MVATPSTKITQEVKVATRITESTPSPLVQAIEICGYGAGGGGDGFSTGSNVQCAGHGGGGSIHISAHRLHGGFYGVGGGTRQQQQKWKVSTWLRRKWSC